MKTALIVLVCFPWSLCITLTILLVRRVRRRELGRRSKVER